MPVARLIAIALLLVMLPARSPAVEINILTGGPTGTYIQIGRDIAKAAEECGLGMTVHESAGSLENFLGVRQRPVTQFGIVQSDVLEYLKTFAANDPEVSRAIFGVRIAFPLYDEEVHLLARKEIGGLADLEGKRVAIGVENSGTFLTASLVLDLAQVSPGERLMITQDESLTALRAGDIDAFFYVAGVPAKLFASEEIDADSFHLVPIGDEVLRQVYKPTEIPAGTYPFQTGPVEAIAVKAVLMTYGYDPRRNAYHRESCKAVSDISHVISSRFQTLQETGHPKWKQVNLTELPAGWDIGECVNVGLAPAYRLPCDPPEAETAATPVDTTSESEANRAYRRQICAVVGC
ncbi:TAXI family TRAP transporter solute-binding subunit [Cereibacter azotoformans]|uniref:KDPG and KHG aldolase n=1 Tax=Cereibacter sphaeroides (strain ATCC 17025 / ATH 2.4.3) TaxID=349102 RepID=A4WXR5_CERS5|nr:TAXI family TRAP transporter solute-binding subunit [Cereibacter azotoformans]ULB11634.1 TAXI family TRAP transporter solute-binding subunit [Cereibacter azotoformans]